MATGTNTQVGCFFIDDVCFRVDEEGSANVGSASDRFDSSDPGGLVREVIVERERGSSSIFESEVGVEALEVSLRVDSALAGLGPRGIGLTIRIDVVLVTVDRLVIEDGAILVNKLTILVDVHA